MSEVVNREWYVNRAKEIISNTVTWMYDKYEIDTEEDKIVAKMESLKEQLFVEFDKKCNGDDLAWANSQAVDFDKMLMIILLTE